MTSKHGDYARDERRPPRDPIYHIEPTTFVGNDGIVVRLQWAEDGEPELYIGSEQVSDPGSSMTLNRRARQVHYLGGALMRAAEEIHGLKQQIAENEQTVIFKVDFDPELAEIIASLRANPWTAGQVVGDGPQPVTEDTAGAEIPVNWHIKPEEPKPQRPVTLKEILAMQENVELKTQVADLQAQIANLQETVSYYEKEIGIADEKAGERSLQISNLSEAIRQSDALALAANEQHAYWYRRCCFAEMALAPFAETYKRVGVEGYDDSTYPIPLSMLRDATEILTFLNVGSELPNYEDTIRDARQKKILKWAGRVFPDDTTPLRRAKWLLYKVAKLYRAVALEAGFDALDTRRSVHHLVDTVFSQAPGNPETYIGGTAVLLSALAESAGVQVAKAERDEFARVLSIPKETFAARWSAKRALGL